jgi:hypothetical protein
MATNTYVELDKVTVATATPSITFTGISGAYTDLVIVMSATTTLDGRDLRLQFNGDTTTNYSSHFISAYSTATTGRATSASFIQFTNLIGTSTVDPTAMLINVPNYANATTFKTVLIRSTQFQTNVGSAFSETIAQCGLWRKTPEAITSVTISVSSSNIAVGSTFSLYGIKSFVADTTPKATGGYVYSDATYYYHAFPYSSTFTPVSSISSVEYVVVAGGGGGGGSRGGGGGAGGYRTGTATISTPLAVTVGAGGLGGTGGGSRFSGSSSSFNSLTSSGGGAGACGGFSSLTGGSGGGGHYESIPGAAGNSGGFTPVEGYAGANAAGLTFGSVGQLPGGGGGGAGAAAPTLANNTVGGNGGVGSSAHSSWLSVVGLGVNGYIAGGGGGARLDGGADAGDGGLGGGGNASTTANRVGQSGVEATGSGGGAGYGGSGGIGDANGGSGGSGLVIIRYPKA